MEKEIIKYLLSFLLGFFMGKSLRVAFYPKFNQPKNLIIQILYALASVVCFFVLTVL